LGDQPGRVIGSENEGYRLLIEKKGKQPEQFELTLAAAPAAKLLPFIQFYYGVLPFWTNTNLVCITWVGPKYCRI
ncbi:MAG: hypothetical protein GY869_20120, partial [Planctomycetes bacterium]|nr:hypothetical protein [Planctomycetota bacterium]